MKNMRNLLTENWVSWSGVNTLKSSLRQAQCSQTMLIHRKKIPISQIMVKKCMARFSLMAPSSSTRNWKNIRTRVLDIKSKKIKFIEFTLTKFSKLPTRTGHGWIPTPRQVAPKNAVVNVENKDEKCFLWSVLAILHYNDIPRDRERVMGIYLQDI